MAFDVHGRVALGTDLRTADRRLTSATVALEQQVLPRVAGLVIPSITGLAVPSMAGLVIPSMAGFANT